MAMKAEMTIKGRAARTTGALLALFAGLLLALVPAVVAADHSPGHVVVPITDDGFGGKAEGFSVEVEEGQVVELTFVFAHQVHLGERHIIVLTGYGLETDEINFYNREGTLRFVASRPGQFEFKCDLDCEIHHLLKSGHLIVRRAGAGAAGGASAASAIVKTALSLEPSTFFAAGGPLTLKATLKDAKGAPVSKAPLRFFVETEFVGRKGQMEIGAAKTDAAGTAAVQFEPTTAGTLPITVTFEGMGLYGDSSVAVEVQSLSPSPAYTVAPIGLDAVRAWAPRIVILVLLGIWATFGYVVYQAYRLARA
ncbi:MAG: hypothetical protein HY332_21180 [Chloroflexi bacterium]|nr:hypothetical protein [Chloroflexota bacterium]